MALMYIRIDLRPFGFLSYKSFINYNFVISFHLNNNNATLCYTPPAFEKYWMYAPKQQ